MDNNKLLLVDTKIFDDRKIYDGCFNRMSLMRQEKIQKFVRERDRRLSLGAGVLLAYGLKMYGISSPRIAVAENGKPYIEGNEVYFNLSHSEEIAIGAFSDKEVGADVERIKSFEKAVADFVFDSEEIQAVRKNTKSDTDREYTKLWTIKESLAKYLGTGLSLNLKSVHIDLSTMKAECQKHDTKKLEFTCRDMGEYIITVCSEYENFSCPEKTGVAELAEYFL